MKKIILLALSFLITGCGLMIRSESIGTSSVPSNYSLSTAAQENSGLLIVATRFTMRCESIVTPFTLGANLGADIWPYGKLYATRDGDKLIDITAYSPLTNLRKADYRSPPGFFHVVKMSPGNYYFNSITGHNAESSSITDRFVSLPFTIEKGKATYVGEVSIAVSECDYSGVDDDEEEENKAVKKEARVKYNVTNHWRRDSQLLKYKYKNIDPSKVKLSITHI